MRRRVEVDVMGAINDHKLKARVTGQIEDTTGVGELEFRYDEIPPAPDWHPLNYTDPLVLLPAYQDGGGGGGTFRALNSPGSFTANCTLDFGNGLLLRKGATINVGDDVITGGYYLIGTARSGHVATAMGGSDGSYAYQEFLHPAGPGQIMGIGYSQWPRRRERGTLVGDPIEAVVSARYRLIGWKENLPGHYVRSLTIARATWDGGRVVTATFNTRVDRLVV